MSPPPRFVAFLRAHVRGGRILEARQLGRERIVRLEVARGGERRVLWVRLWAGAANLVVTGGDGLILDALYRRPKRGEISGRPFDPEAQLRERLAGYPEEDRYAVRDLPGPGTFNERIEAHYAALEAAEAGSRARQARLQELEGRENALEAALAGLRKRRAEYARFDELREAGERILAWLHTLHRGDRWLQADGAGVELDPRLSPSENAERYFQRYRKAKSGVQALDGQIAEAEAALSKVREQKERVGEAEAGGAAGGGTGTPPETPAAPPRGPRGRGGAAAREGPPGTSFQSHGFLILVGRTATDNDRLLRRFVNGNDWWFHARDYPGAHVFVRAAAGKSPPLEVMLDAGNLAVFYSKGRQSGGGDVYYTRVKYLRRVKEGRPGQVIPTQERNLSIRLDGGRLRRLTGGSGQAPQTGSSY